MIQDTQIEQNHPANGTQEHSNGQNNGEGSMVKDIEMIDNTKQQVSQIQVEAVNGEV